MAKLLIDEDTTSYRLSIFVQDSSDTDGTGLTGLTDTSPGLAWYRWREDDGNVAATQISAIAGTRGTFASSGFVEKDDANMPGFYEIGVPNSVLASGSNWVDMVLRGATNMAPVPIEIQLIRTMPELGVGVPPAQPSPREADMLHYMHLRNAGQSTTTTRRIKNDAGTTVAQGTMSEDGVTFDQGRLGSG